jgi:uncharacterized protein YkwD
VPPGPHIRRARFFLALLLGTVAVGLAGQALAAGPEIEAQPVLADAIRERVNDYRHDHGLRRLDVAPGLVRAARELAVTMATEGTFSHTTRQVASVQARIARYYPGSDDPGWSVGENLYWSTGRASAADVVEAWFASPAHHQTLLSDRWEDIGLSAVVVKNAPGVFGGRTVTIVVADFGTRGKRS